jgi:hypothetical protein
LERNAEQASQQLGDVVTHRCGFRAALVAEHHLHQCWVVITWPAEPGKAVGVGLARCFDRAQARLKAGLHSSQCGAEGLISLKSSKRQLRAQRWC